MNVVYEASKNTMVQFSSLANGDCFRQKTDEDEKGIYVKVEGGYVSLQLGFYWKNVLGEVIPVKATVTWSY